MSEKRPSINQPRGGASPTYSQVASVLAGFAFAAVVLIAQDESVNPFRKEIVTISFLLAFFGCVVASFNFAATAGQVEVSSRLYVMGLFSGGGFLISTLYIFWGLAVLLSIYVSGSIAALAFLIFACVAFLSPSFLIVALIDMARTIKRTTDLGDVVLPRGLRLPLLCIYVPMGIGLGVRVFTSRLLTEQYEWIFLGISAVAILLIGMGALLNVLSGLRPPDSYLKAWQSSAWILAHSAVIATLCALLPSL